MSALRFNSSNRDLPLPLSSLIGRKREVLEIKRLLKRKLLVTLTGAGGVGKTRLAIQVATELLGKFKHGTWLIKLAPLTEPSLVPQTIASILNLHELPNRSIMEALVEYLSVRQLLLVLDNCEHLISTCTEIADLLLKRCSGLRILATSREVLGITGKVDWAVPPLSFPSSQTLKNPAGRQAALSQYEASESVQLF